MLLLVGLGARDCGETTTSQGVNGSHMGTLELDLVVRVFVKSLLRVGPGETALDLESSSRRREFASFTINGTVQPDFLSQLFQIESPQVHRFIQALHVIITSFEYVLSGRQHLKRLVQLGLTHLWLPQVLLRVVAVHVLAGNARCRPVHSLWVHQ